MVGGNVRPRLLRFILWGSFRGVIFQRLCLQLLTKRSVSGGFLATATTYHQEV